MHETTIYREVGETLSPTPETIKALIVKRGLRYLETLGFDGVDAKELDLRKDQLIHSAGENLNYEIAFDQSTIVETREVLGDSDPETEAIAVLCDGLVNKKDKAEVANWLVDNFAIVLSSSPDESSGSYLNTMLNLAGSIEGQNREFYQKFLRLLSSKKPNNDWDKGFTYKDGAGNEFWLSDLDAFTLDVNSFWKLSQSETIKGVLSSIGSMQDGENRANMLGFVMANLGVGETLGMLRLTINDERIETEDKVNALRLFRSFYETVGIDSESPDVPVNAVDLYSKIVNVEQFMTEREGGERVREILQIIREREEKLGNDPVIWDIASGTGWLVELLRREGYWKTLGVEPNTRLIEESQKRFGEGLVVEGNWFNLGGVEGAEGLDLAVINGRSLNHLRSVSDFRDLMLELSHSKTIVFDMASPDAGPIKDRLDKLRGSFSKLGFSKEWLEGYMFNGVGSHDGVVFGDRWYPPQHWVETILGCYGFSSKVKKEENYDGLGGVNLFYVADKVEDEEKRRELVEKSEIEMRRIFESEPLNPNGHTTRGVEPRSISYHKLVGV